MRSRSAVRIATVTASYLLVAMLASAITLGVTDPTSPKSRNLHLVDLVSVVGSTHRCQDLLGSNWIRFWKISASFENLSPKVRNFHSKYLVFNLSHTRYDRFLVRVPPGRYRVNMTISWDIGNRHPELWGGGPEIPKTPKGDPAHASTTLELLPGSVEVLPAWFTCSDVLLLRPRTDLTAAG